MNNTRRLNSFDMLISQPGQDNIMIGFSKIEIVITEKQPSNEEEIVKYRLLWKYMQQRRMKQSIYTFSN